MLPLELGNPDLFGDDLQLVPGCVMVLLESAGIAVRVARTGGVGTARRPRGISRHGQSCSWSRGRVPSDESESTKKIVREEIRSRRVCEEADDHHLRRTPVRLPSALSLVGRMLPLLAMELLGVLVLGEEELELAEAWEAEHLVKG
jgi:hypothetical protein